MKRLDQKCFQWWNFFLTYEYISNLVAAFTEETKTTDKTRKRSQKDNREL